MDDYCLLLEQSRDSSGLISRCFPLQRSLSPAIVLPLRNRTRLFDRRAFPRSSISNFLGSSYCSLRLTQAIERKRVRWIPFGKTRRAGFVYYIDSTARCRTRE